MKVYRTVRYPKLMLSSTVQFKDFLFRTDDPRVQEWLEHHPMFQNDFFLDSTSG